MTEIGDSSQTILPSSGAIAMVQLFDTVLLHIARAGDATRKGDFQAQFDELMKATRIIDGLNRVLDMEAGGQVAVHMREMYQATSRALLRSVGKESAVEVYGKISEGLLESRNAWAEISGVAKIG